MPEEKNKGPYVPESSSLDELSLSELGGVVERLSAMHKDKLRQKIESIEAGQVKDYLLGCGCSLKGLRPGIMVWRSKDLEVVVPSDKSYRDFESALSRALVELALHQKTSVSHIVDGILNTKVGE